ncbi:MAG: hypothetical protein WKF84_30880 [Pyrinomonadaceae bacterium]
MDGLTERGAPRIVEEYRQGRLYLPNYRGRNCYPKPLQAAEFFVRSETGLTGIDDLRLLDCTNVTEGMLRARFSSAGDDRVHEVGLQITSRVPGGSFMRRGKQKRRAV